MDLERLVELTCAHSPDSDDAFMFYALATRKIRSPYLRFRHVLEDIETLNQKARQGIYDLTAISIHAYAYVAEQYVLLRSGASVGDGYGPMLIAARPLGPEEIRGRRVAIPGRLTTAYLVLKLYEPEIEEVLIPFDRVPEAVRQGAADLGLVIHEVQLTYDRVGFHKVIDLGRWWKQRYGLILPLGGLAVRRSMDPELQRECARLVRESIQYGLEHHEEALNYAMQFAREMDEALAEKFVGMYVNDYTVDGGPELARAIQHLLDLGFEAGLIPRKTEVELL